jgi:hypothetical protein
MKWRRTLMGCIICCKVENTIQLLDSEGERENDRDRERMRYDGEERVEGWRGEGWRGEGGGEGIHASLEPRPPPPSHDVTPHTSANRGGGRSLNSTYPPPPLPAAGYPIFG